MIVDFGSWGMAHCSAPMGLWEIVCIRSGYKHSVPTGTEELHFADAPLGAICL